MRQAEAIVWRVVLSCAIGASSSAVDAHENLAPSPIRVEWIHGRLIVDADGVPLAELLAAVGNATGAQLRGLAALDGRASVHIAKVALREGLDAMLAQVNYAIVEQPSINRGDAHIVLFVLGYKSGAGTDAYAAQERGASRQTSQPDAANAHDAYQTVERLADNGDVRALRDTSASDDPTTRALAMQRLARQDPAGGSLAAIDAARSADPTQRVLALQVLAGLDKPESTAALGAALDDPDSAVRQAAVVALMGHTSPVALQFLMQGIQDHDASVRALALELLARRDVTASSALMNRN
jgi:hypothetical protein